MAWREKVRAYHANRSNKAKPTPGAVVDYCGHQYRLDRPYAPRKGWAVTRVSDGMAFRMNARQVSQALSA